MKRILSVIIAAFMVLGLASCGKSYEDMQSTAKVNAKMVYTAVQGVLDDNPEVQIVNTDVYNMESGVLNISLDRKNSISLSPYLGDKFDGYYYAEIDSYSRTVEFALWSEERLDLDYYDYVDFTNRAYFEGTGNVIGYWGY